MAKVTNRPLTVVALIITFGMAALEATVVATAMPTIIGDLGGIAVYRWVLAAYMLTATVPVPIYGKLADLYGRKPLLLFGIAVFLLGSVASGASRTMTELILFRALQGLGAGSMQPVALTIVGDIFDLDERAKMQGLFSSVWGVAGVAGPLVGSLVVRSLGWRWIFYLNVPLGLAAAILLYTQLHETIDKKPGRIFVRGALLLTVGIVALLAAPRFSWAGALATVAVSALSLAAFFAVERRSPEPILPLSLFRRRVIAIASLAGAIIGGVMLVLLSYLPAHMQIILHGTVEDAGVAVTPMMIAWPIASTIAGRILPKVGFRPLVHLGLFLTGASAVFLAFAMHRGATANDIRIASAVFGCGMGFANTSLLIAVQVSVAWKERGIATASTMFFRNIGGLIAVGLLGSLVDNAVAADPRLAGVLSEILSPVGARDATAADLHAIAERVGGGFDRMFTIVAGLGVAAFLVSLWFPKIATHDQPPATAAPGH